ncbi:L-threonylcarbamoyladenylate synthase [Cyclonatronum proteinivorum]|uniref:Threonylcarbamoyl-AMP synthase n=1 Tax=Cyclonatronum proteinivorum TaxID=1457365 RepID=A0A345UKC1_9BACT|nr:L-threonylcarbamoyladenylate synthase [Cyclonatronum proteinivorum]AXJ00923.1 L-threonylcarbamoyladenylate synthase [Cyclonatronum proteinivorum]
MPLREQQLQTYADLLRQGELVVFPTETVYGLGASAWNAKAVRKIFETKGRPADNPLIVHISNVDMVKQFTPSVSARVKLVMQKFWPGPLTLILRKKEEVPDIVTAGLDTVALRMPNHPVALQLIELSGPLVAPSANKSGRPSPTRPEHIFADYGKKLPVIDGGPCNIGIESTVLDLTQNPPLILRPGNITAADIHSACGFLPRIITAKEATEAHKPKSPGMKYAHYAPKARVAWFDPDQSLPDSPKALVLCHSSAPQLPDGFKGLFRNGDFTTFAQELYNNFRQADAEGFPLILIEKFAPQQLINDERLISLHNRISKATGKAD